MGTLVAKHYSTPLFANQADHTYVECGTGGKGWKCWGRKSGGAELRRGDGSTARADRIAGSKERANIKCYLINGVCHQAANRVLLPAGITVRGARGYWISEALYGTYGRLGFWPCSAPFKQWATVRGDLPECAAAARALRVSEASAQADQYDWAYTQGVLPLYERAEGIKTLTGTTFTKRRRRWEVSALAEMQAFHLELFSFMCQARLGPEFELSLARKLLQIRRETERKREEPERPFGAKEITQVQLADQIDTLTLAFQDAMANAMQPEQYRALFDVNAGDRVLLADRSIIGHMSDG